MDTEAYPREDVKKLLGAMIVIKINPETSKEGKKVAEDFDVHSFPRLIILTPKGDKLKEIKGSPKPEGYEGSFTGELWNAYVGFQDAKPQDVKGMASSLAKLVMWYPDTKYGKEAARIKEQYKDKADFTEQWNKDMAQHELELQALKADAQLKLGKKKEAIETWKALRAAHPDTPECAEAEKQLKKLNVKLDAPPPADPPKK